jgi:hypothetical protein
MEPVLIILIPGVVGGLFVALLMARKWRANPSIVVSKSLEAPSPTLINMAHIKVEGIGGLGMVAAVVAVAIADSRIRVAMIVALVLGGGLALLLIAARRRTGALGSGGEGPDERSTLHLADDRRRTPPGAVQATIDEVKRARALLAYFKSFA